MGYLDEIMMHIFFFIQNNNNVTPTINDNKVLETTDVPNNDTDLRLAYLRQSEELRLIKRQLANSQLRVKELEDQIQTMRRSTQQKSL